MRGGRIPLTSIYIPSLWAKAGHLFQFFHQTRKTPLFKASNGLQAFYLRIVDGCSYNPRMSGPQTGRCSPAVLTRVIAVLLLAALAWSHPVQASVLRFCSHAGGLVEPGRDCCKPEAAASCCVGGKEHSAGGVSIGSASCSDCCELFTLEEIDPAEALGSSSNGEIETALRNSSAEPAWNASPGPGPDSSLALEPQSRLPGRGIYLLTCRFLI